MEEKTETVVAVTCASCGEVATGPYCANCGNQIRKMNQNVFLHFLDHFLGIGVLRDFFVDI